MHNWFCKTSPGYETVRQEADMKRHRTMTIRLSEGEFLAQKRPDMEIVCTAGALWLTDGSGTDRILHQGLSIAVSSRMTLCITALGDSEFTMHSAIRHSKLETISAFLSDMMNGRESPRRSAVPE